jgi:hypothetical protein
MRAGDRPPQSADFLQGHEVILAENCAFQTRFRRGNDADATRNEVVSDREPLRQLPADLLLRVLGNLGEAQGNSEGNLRSDEILNLRGIDFHFNADRWHRILLSSLADPPATHALTFFQRKRRSGSFWQDCTARRASRGFVGAKARRYRLSKEFLEAGKKRLLGDTTREVTAPGVKTLRDENVGMISANYFMKRE